ncbi:hypothetical protein [Rhizobium leguminosarum]|uniref:hypothetical protein n=1 Tax=Rhizobium leguminosarum TaxID=384 RepID=UPI0021B13402|nr:hypothetical protein [Rhizobium leguminosarum]MBY2917380.1 hypothetical protein [Rhizobium leguminosarum]MBY2972619.1 hypothetical protein [Rhizobium leguminosarum]MBY2980019.1 hypothetical protein [Rhizobium leguminosarum]MBY3002149.1 hypothetical protein [Rhizobium leguminosarum]MBY3008570.1 hypothetical protein [Rhizobium leguminosarum]
MEHLGRPEPPGCLHARSRQLSQPDKDNDIAILMSALAVTMEAVRSLCEDMNQLNGPKGLGSDGH